MEAVGIIALIFSILLSGYGIIEDARQTKKAREFQAEHDEAMAALNHRYREEEAISSQEREANYNQYEIEKNKMLSAGFSPSLMYGGSLPATSSISSVGSSQGSGNVGIKPDFSKFLGKLDPAEYSSQAIDRINALTMKEKTKSDILRNEQEIRESISRENENRRKTDFQRRLEWTLEQQEAQTLRNMELSNRSLDFDIGLKQEQKPLQMRKLELENEDLIKRIDYTAEQIKTEGSKRAALAADVRVANAQVKSLEAGTAESKARTKTENLDRVMKTVGLNARSINPALRNLSNISPLMAQRLKAGVIMLEECGFSREEAEKAVLYYCASDTKDLKPSAINAFSRIVSSALK